MFAVRQSERASDADSRRHQGRRDIIEIDLARSLPQSREGLVTAGLTKVRALRQREP
jgi:hypothetical protein